MSDAVFENLVRTGTVRAVDRENWKARVYFPSLDLLSDWLFVLKTPQTIEIAGDGGHLHTIPPHETETTGEHNHPGSYLPETTLNIVPDGQHGHGVPVGQTGAAEGHAHPVPAGAVEEAETHDHPGSVVPQTEVVIAEDGNHEHPISEWKTAGVDDHRHEGTRLISWFPAVNDKVLVLYIPIHNGDGFILGGI